MTALDPSRFRRLSIVALAAGAAVAVGACSTAAAPSWTYPPSTSGTAAAEVLAGPPAAAPMPPAMGNAMSMPGAAAAAPAAVAQVEPAGAAFSVNLTIVTGDMIGHTEFPAFIPADITVPANSTVLVTITNFDDATPLPKGAEQYAKVAGTVGGTATVTPIRPTYPNSSSGNPQTITSMDPANVSHTLTVPGLGLNVPIAPNSRETFTLRTGAAGVYSWHCMDPCGDGATGWGTAMAMKKGFMEGSIAVV